MGLIEQIQSELDAVGCMRIKVTRRSYNGLSDILEFRVVVFGHTFVRGEYVCADRLEALHKHANYRDQFVTTVLEQFYFDIMAHRRKYAAT